MQGSERGLKFFVLTIIGLGSLYLTWVKAHYIKSNYSINIPNLINDILRIYDK